MPKKVVQGLRQQNPISLSILESPRWICTLAHTYFYIKIESTLAVFWEEADLLQLKNFARLNEALLSSSRPNEYGDFCESGDFRGEASWEQDWGFWGYCDKTHIISVFPNHFSLKPSFSKPIATF